MPSNAVGLSSARGMNSSPGLRSSPGEVPSEARRRGAASVGRRPRQVGLGRLLHTPDAISHSRQASRSRQPCIRAWSVRSKDSGITVTAGSHSASTSVPSAVWANSMPLPFGQ